MKLLAWDTSSKFGAVCALEGDPETRKFQIRAEFSLGVEAAHSERLLWAIHQTLEASRWKVADVDVFAVGVGPGSFTGLRIGITTGRTLAHTLGKPLQGFSSMAALLRPYAETLALSHPKALVLAETDACKGEWFTLMGEPKELLLCRHAEGFSKVGKLSSGPNLWRKSVKEEVQSPEDAMKVFVSAVKKGRKKWAVFGDELSHEASKDLMKGLSAKSRIQISYDRPLRVLPKYAAVLAFEAFCEGAKAEPLEVHPRYLRVADAEKKLKEGLLKKNAPTRGLDGAS